MSNTFEMKRIAANGMNFGYIEAGSGPLALCLHGFPDTAHTWRHLLPALASAGFRAVAPCLRGYGPTDIPPDGAYQVGAFAADANALHEAFGGDERAVIIGNDFGSLATYGAIQAQPQRWRKAVSIAVPPHKVLAQAFMDPDMMKRIFYIFMFNTEVGDAVLKQDIHPLLASLWKDWSPGLDASDDLALLRDSLNTPERQAAITRGYFQARVGTSKHLPKYAVEQQAFESHDLPARPVLYLHGRNDGVVPVRLVEHSAPLAMGPQGRMQVVDGGGHFLQLDQPEIVNRLIIDWVQS